MKINALVRELGSVGAMLERVVGYITDPGSTCAPLLQKARDISEGDQHSVDGDDQEFRWKFELIYRRSIEREARHNGLRPIDAHEVAQSVLDDTWRKLSTFEYREGGSFRGWLAWAVYSAVSGLRRNNRRVVPIDQNQISWPADSETSDTLVRQEEAGEWAREVRIFEQAKKNVRSRLKREGKLIQWNVHSERMRKGNWYDAHELARKFGIERQDVFNYVHKVSRLIKDECQSLSREN
jgi:hypothetical protein